MKKIAIQGIKGSFHDIAAHQYFKGEDIELICCDTFEKVFDEMRHEGSLFALVAIENTIADRAQHNVSSRRRLGHTLGSKFSSRGSHAMLPIP